MMILQFNHWRKRGYQFVEYVVGMSLNVLLVITLVSISSLVCGQDQKPRTSVLDKSAEQVEQSEQNSKQTQAPPNPSTGLGNDSDTYPESRLLYQDILSGQTNNIQMQLRIPEPGCADNQYDEMFPVSNSANQKPASIRCKCASCDRTGRKHRRKNCKSKRGTLGFAVEEVQHGANAGLPSFGVVSHGPWYNGPVFSPSLPKCGKLFKLRGGKKAADSKTGGTGNTNCENCDARCSSCQAGCDGGIRAGAMNVEPLEYDGQPAPNFEPISDQPQ